MANEHCCTSFFHTTGRRIRQLPITAEALL
jgi:hypothetical protein